jgi:glycosyltransferase involved in cell wall biosynthesis
MRTAILADKLIAEGHSVIWWASAFEHQGKHWIANHDRDFILSRKYKIKAVKGMGYKKNVSISRYLDHYVIARKFARQVHRHQKPDIIVASMPCNQLAYKAAQFARKNGIPILIDIRDFWPDIFYSKLPKIIENNIGKIIFLYDELQLKKSLHAADGLISISAGGLNWGLKKIGRQLTDNDKVFYHGYQRQKGFSHSFNKMLEGFGDKKIITFIGTFGKSYEIDILIEAARRYKNYGNKDTIFVLAGKGEQYDHAVKTTKCLDNLIFTGWLKADEIKSLLRKSYAGVAPCISFTDSFPNKVFEYLSEGLPVISSLVGEFEDIINRYKIGINYKVGDCDGFYQAVKCLTENKEMKDKLTENAKGFFKKHCDAVKIYQQYVKHIEKIAQKH